MVENYKKPAFMLKKPLSQLEKWQDDAGINETLAENPINRLTGHIPTSTEDRENVEMPDIEEGKALDTSFNYSGNSLDEITNLRDLRSVISEYEDCSLKNTANNLVFSDGKENAAIMFVGEAPGADEDRQGKPFVGASGQLLDRMLASIGLDRESIYISILIIFRPPGNRQPTPNEIDLCLPFIKRHIQLIDPKVLVLVGGTAAKSLLNKKEGIMRLRGRWFEYDLDGGGTTIPAFPIYHPAFLLRSPVQKSNAWKDLIQIKSKLNELSIE